MCSTCSFLSLVILKAIGRQEIPPYWGLGFQLSRWNYGTLDRIKEVVQELKDADIPHVSIKGPGLKVPVMISYFKFLFFPHLLIFT